MLQEFVDHCLKNNNIQAGRCSLLYSLLFHDCVKTLTKGAFMHLVAINYAIIITPLNILSWTMILQKMEVTEYKAAYTTMINLLV